MYLVTLMIQGQAQHPVLQYTALERAKAAVEAASSPNSTITYGGGKSRITLSDDFGRIIPFDPDRLDLVLFQDLDKALEGDRTVRLKQAQSEAQFAKTAASDPTIQAAQRMMQMTNGGAGFRQ